MDQSPHYFGPEMQRSAQFLTFYLSFAPPSSFQTAWKIKLCSRDRKQRMMIAYLRKSQYLTIRSKLVSGNDTGFIQRFLHNGPDTVEELLDRHVVKKDKSVDDEEEELLTRQRLTSTRREALSLYRDILRASRFFMWPDSRGVLWRDILRENARKELEEARFEKDPETVTRLLIGGRDAVQSTLEKLAEKQRQQIEKERGGGDGR